MWQRNEQTALSLYFGWYTKIVKADSAGLTSRFTNPARLMLSRLRFVLMDSGHLPSEPASRYIRPSAVGQICWWWPFGSPGYREERDKVSVKAVADGPCENGTYKSDSSHWMLANGVYYSKHRQVIQDGTNC